MISHDSVTVSACCIYCFPVTISCTQDLLIEGSHVALYLLIQDASQKIDIIKEVEKNLTEKCTNMANCLRSAPSIFSCSNEIGNKKKLAFMAGKEREKEGNLIYASLRENFGLIPDCVGISLMAASYMRMSRT
jgi:hypothetical protein